MTSKVASGLPRATTVSKVPLTQPQTPMAPKHNSILLPNSMAPGHLWAFKSQERLVCWKPTQKAS